MPGSGSANAYEEARNRRLAENRKRFEDLGILEVSRSLMDLSNSGKKSNRSPLKPRKESTFTSEPRRSSRARNPVLSYSDQVDEDLPSMRKRGRSKSSWGSYLARPLDEVKEASYEVRELALKTAEQFLYNLQTRNPSFVKSMLRSHVYSCFWLGLPAKFCEDHLGKATFSVVIEDDKSAEYEAIYIGSRTGLSGGWRAFALDHKLDDGDALVFELTEPKRFKVYITRAFELSRKELPQKKPGQEPQNGETKKPRVGSEQKRTNRRNKVAADENDNSEDGQAPETAEKIDGEVKPQQQRPTKQKQSAPQKLRKKANSNKTSAEEKTGANDGGDDNAARKLPVNETDGLEDCQKLEQEDGAQSEAKPTGGSETKNQSTSEEEIQKTGRPADSNNQKKRITGHNSGHGNAQGPRKAAIGRLLRRRV